MGKAIQNPKKGHGAFVKLQGKTKFNKSTKQNKVYKQKVPLIKKNGIASANTSPTKVKQPKISPTKLVSPLAGEVEPKKVPAKNQKKVIKPKPPAKGGAAGTQQKNNAQKPVSSAKPTKKPQKNNTDEIPEKKVYDPEDKKRTIFIGNLAPNTKKKQVEMFCNKFGEVKSVRLRTAGGKVLYKHKMRKTTPSLNAYVVMKSEECVAKALKESGCEFRGRHIRIGRTSLHDVVDSKRVLFVGNLKFTATDEKLHDIFSTCGEIEYVRTLQGENGCKGVAYVGFKKPESVTLALELNNTMLDERPIRVERYSKYKQELKKLEKVPDNKLQLPTGAAKRIADKAKMGKSTNNMKNDKPTTQAPKENKKKSAFRGVKVDIKKKPKNKKPSAMVQLAKKIAPKN